MAVSIRHAADWLNTGFDYLEIQTLAPERAALPITETSYRSHFLYGSELESFGAPSLSSSPGSIAKRNPKHGKPPKQPSGSCPSFEGQLFK